MTNNELASYQEYQDQTFEGLKLSDDTVEKIKGALSCTFKNCVFNNMDFSCSIFDECTFISCSFITPALNDVRFLNVWFNECKLVGVDFRH